MKILLVITLILVACTKKPHIEVTPFVRESIESILQQSESDVTAAIENESIELDDVLFPMNSYSLKGLNSVFILKALAKYMKANPKTKVNLDGHACEIGTDDYNLALSAYRTSSVADYLIDLGIDSDRMTLKYYGEIYPLGGENYLNRRVEISIQ